MIEDDLQKLEQAYCLFREGTSSLITSIMTARRTENLRGIAAYVKKSSEIYKTAAESLDVVLAAIEVEIVKEYS